MVDDIRFKVSQDPKNRLIKLEVWRQYGDKPDEWINDESLTGLSFKEFKKLGEYINSKTTKKS